MLFSLVPKNCKDDLFDREEELSKLKSLVMLYPITIITGLRRVGKSSLVNVFLHEGNYTFVCLDGRKLYQVSGGNITSLHLSQILNEEFLKLSKSQRFLNFLKRIKGVSVAGNSIEIDPKKLELSEVFEKFNDFAEKEKKDFVVFLDEAQYFRFYGSRGGNDILALLSYCYDHLKGLRFLISGSEMGVLHDFLKLDDYNSPFYGKGVGSLVLKPFSMDQSEAFLEKGFKEIGEQIDFDIKEVVREIDGIVGYLVLFGTKYQETKNKDKALKEVYYLMESLFQKELSELARKSPRYLVLLKHIANGVKNWSGLKNLLIANGDFITDSRLYSLLDTLKKMSFIEKTQEGYKISDPVLEKILSS